MLFVFAVKEIIMHLKARAAQLAADIPAVFLALRHKGTPWYAKAAAAVTVGYALSPIDLIPDFIPVLGYLDDVLLLPLLVAVTIKQIPPAVFAACRVQAQALWANGKPKKWYYAVPVLLVWAAVLCCLIKAFL